MQLIKDRLQNKEKFELQCVWCNFHFNNKGAINYNVITLHVQCTLYLLGKFFQPCFCQLLHEHQGHHQNLKHLRKKKLQRFEIAEYIKNLDTTLKIKWSIQFGSSHILSPLKLHGSFECKLKNCMSGQNSSSM